MSGQVPVGQTAHLQEPFPVKQKRNRSWIGAVVLVLIIVLMLVAAYAVTLAPEHYAQAQAVRVDGVETVSIGDPSVATVVPGAEWGERPMVAPLIGELRFFKNPAVIFGSTPGVQLESPDGMLTVTLEPLGLVAPAAVFAAEGQPGALVQEEVLSTGLSLAHVYTGESASEAVDGLVAIVGPEAESSAGASLLIRVSLSDDAKFDFSEYLPALSALFESIELES